MLRRRFSHAMLAVGYGSKWRCLLVGYEQLGAELGEEGYIRIARGENTCGVLSRAYPAI